MKAKEALRLIEDELELAMSKHEPFNSPHEAYAVILEEMDELWEEVKANNGTTHRGVSEAVQIGAMAARYLADLCEQDAADQHEKKVERYVHADYGTSFGGYSG